ncbi:hypothetical protein PMZ80_008075 [Knufia obscura]|uniref:Dipeptidyl-peptidase V n=1 Tax=Knufia obscura TaxID=1635080 RepID=A0ABR0RHH4_9EURO|nr:hypothetical protein PMZ80_008075 [Knufia obscura]
MTIKIKKFGPEQLLGAPRRSPGYPSPDGKKFLFTQSVYSFDSHSKSSEIVVFDFESGEQNVISTDNGASEPKWLGDANQLVWLKEGDNGNTSVIVADVHSPGKTYTAGTIAGPVSSLKLYEIKDGMIAMAVAGKANPDGSLHNPKNSPKERSTAKVYDATFVRHWDSYVTKERDSIFTAVLQKAPARVQGREGRYNLVGFMNALKGTGLECPIPPFGGTDHFDIGPKGLAIVAKDPDLNPATHTKCNAYFIPKEDLMDLAESKPRKIQVPHFNGAATCPVWAPNGLLGFLQMREDGYESDQNHIFEAAIGDANSDIQVRQLSSSSEPPFDPHNNFWSLSPSSFVWSPDSKFLYVQAEYQGAGCLWAYPINVGDYPLTIRQLTNRNFITEAIPIPQSSTILISSNSLVDNSIYSLLNPFNMESSPGSIANQPSTTLTVLPQPSFMHNQFGLYPTQVNSLWWKGAHDHPIHALMMRPSNFDASKKYPLAYLVHGGPQGAWNDQWSTRWSPALFAEQGYIVIAPNPTGSTGYGQPFTNAIKNNWGGSPYTDLERGITHIESHLPFVDTTRMVALGASYGGYMMNWMAGHPLSKKFKALVCHDGVFSMTGQLASEEQYFPQHDFGGPIWERQEVYDKWDPARHTSNWTTPMLIIHNELDYRLTISEGLSAFNVLQGKGIESRFLTFSDEGHWVLKEENALVWCLVVLNWCNRFVGLGEVRDRMGRNGDEFCRVGRRGEPSDK